MKIKQIKTFLLAAVLILSAFIGTLSITGSASALVCPTGQDWHESDNACWTVKTSTGTKCTGDEIKTTNGQRTCYTYTRSDTAPKNEDGTKASLSCPADQEYHDTDNACYTAKTTTGTKCTGDKVTTTNGVRTCVSYEKSDTNPTLVEQTTDAQKKAARDDVYNKCKATGKSDDECNKAADQAATDCENNASYTDCMKNKTATDTENETCADDSTPDATTNKCADGSDPVKIDDPTDEYKKCGQASTVLIACEGDGVVALGNVLRIFISVLTVLIGIVAVGGLAWASVTYARAEDNSGTVSDARTLIRNIVIGILLYGFMVAIINWLVPGGVIG